jgi:hypothetical protein
MRVARLGAGANSAAALLDDPERHTFHLGSEEGLYPLCAEHLLLLLMCGASCKYDAIHQSPMPSPLHLTYVKAPTRRMVNRGRSQSTAPSELSVVIS